MPRRESGYFYYSIYNPIVLFWKGKVHFLHSIAVDGSEVIFHGDDVIAGVASFHC